MIRRRKEEELEAAWQLPPRHLRQLHPGRLQVGYLGAVVVLACLISLRFHPLFPFFSKKIG
ncbi:hypothetical protein GQ55_3G165400 [Panicum hallii var. hallii]|uniref:Uncharacterized protein n=1 Tax=Panicum hallii var. hallii TaxID=1504633 RepID=A0A2T7EA57_9POAL|nr:hypothetical protein GQ55_3G165400 [Panicum hallii var. hallii]